MIAAAAFVPLLPLILRCGAAASKEPSRDRAAGWSPPSRPAGADNSG
jgi:hypothetical protein